MILFYRFFATAFHDGRKLQKKRRRLNAMKWKKYRPMWWLVSAAIVSCIFWLNGQAQDMTEGDLTLKYLVQQPADKPAHPPVIILLHGFGSNEADLFELRNAFPKEYLIVSARAPMTLGADAYQWYRHTNIDGQMDGNPQDLKDSVAKVKQFISEIVKKYHSDPSRVYLMGFSQGAIMSYEVGLTSPELLTGIGVFSGTIFPSLKPQIKPSNALQKLRIFIGHGTADDRIAYASAINSVAYLRTLNLAPSFHSYPGMTHQMNEEELADVNRWLAGK
jgi:phospholipase/carboxylesterase